VRTETKVSQGAIAKNKGLTGSLVLGFFLVFSTERALLDPRWRLLIAVGFCGSYTTFSSYAFESFALMEQGQWLLTGLNIVASNALCLAAVLAGAALGEGTVKWQPTLLSRSKVMAVQVTIYLTEGDSWHHRPLHLEILKYLREENSSEPSPTTPWPASSDAEKSGPRTSSKPEGSCRS
jgi:protein CrcB